jgi:DNA-binding XRE family transcriptional regulator
VTTLNINLLRGAMAEAEVTQDQLAKAIGVSRSTLSSKMNEHRSFDTEEVKAICDFLNIGDMAKRAEIFLS